MSLDWDEIKTARRFIMTETRIVGIRHRIKRTAEEEARPTQVAIMSGGEIITYDLPDDTAELDWARGVFPVEMRKVIDGEDLSGFAPHHIIWKKLKVGEADREAFNRGHLKKEANEWFIASKVPDKFDGLKPCDKVAMVLGGSGDRFAYALSRSGELISAEVWRVPPFTLKDFREGDKKEDAVNLAKLLEALPKLFYQVTQKDRQLIRLRKAFRGRTDAMKARISCEQRLRQHFIGEIFCDEHGLYPEGSIELAFDRAKFSDAILQSLFLEEKVREKELVAIVKNLDAYQQLFAPIKGCGPMIATRLIVAIQDIRRFETPAKLKAFCGVHVMPDGKFVRRRHGAVANWHSEARQALYLLGDQFNRNPDSPWGKKLREYKLKLREKHPEPVVVDDKKRYSDGHIHKMAVWRTLTKFVEHLWHEWRRIANSQIANGQDDKEEKLAA